MARTRKGALWVDTEPTYGTDPSANGSGYLVVPTLTLGDLKDGKELLETNYYTGRNFPTAPVAGADGWSFDCTIPVIGLASAAGDGVNASSVSADWFDDILAHIFTAVATTAGEGVTTSDATGITLEADDPYSVQDLVPVYQATIPSGAVRTQWALVTTDAGGGDYEVAPNWASSPGDAAVAYGSKSYRPSDAGGGSLAFVYRQDDLDYTLLGGRCTSAKLTANAKQIAALSLTFSGDTKTQESKGSLPAVTAQTLTPIKGMLSPFWFNGTLYATSAIEIDFGLETAEQASTAAVNGRANFENMAYKPSVTVQPLFTAALQDLKRNITKGRIMLQLGSGVLSSGVLNTCCFACEEAIAEAADPVDDSGRRRVAITFRVTDKVEFSSGVAARFFQFNRA